MSLLLSVLVAWPLIILSGTFVVLFVWPVIGSHVDRWLRGDRPLDEGDVALYIYPYRKRTVRAMEASGTRERRGWHA